MTYWLMLKKNLIAQLARAKNVSFKVQSSNCSVGSWRKKKNSLIFNSMYYL